MGLKSSDFCSVLGVAKLGSLDTRHNPAGLVQLSADPSLELLAFPGHKPGSAQILVCFALILFRRLNMVRLETWVPCRCTPSGQTF